MTKTRIRMRKDISSSFAFRKTVQQIQTQCVQSLLSFLSYSWLPLNQELLFFFLEGKDILVTININSHLFVQRKLLSAANIHKDRTIFFYPDAYFGFQQHAQTLVLRHHVQGQIHPPDLVEGVFHSRIQIKPKMIHLVLPHVMGSFSK